MARPYKNPFLERPWLENNGAAKSKSKKSFKGIIVGGITGAVETLITYPMEYVKTQLQLDGEGKENKFNGTLDCFRKTINKYGVTGLYRGLDILVYGSVPKTAVRFGSFEFFKSHSIDEYGKLHTKDYLLCGLGAGICEAIFVVTPMDTIKVKFINDQRRAIPKYHGFFHGIGIIFKKKGLHGLYQGLLPTILRQSGNQAIRFYSYGLLKDLYQGGDHSIPIPIPIVGLFGSISGGLSAIITTPVDVVTTRMQGFHAYRYTTTLDCAAKIWREEGLHSFYRGVAPRLMRVSSSVAIQFMTYDTVMMIFNKIWP